MKNIGIVTMMYGRPQLTNEIFRYYNNIKEKLKQEVNLVLVVSGSEGDLSKNIAINNGFNYVETPNKPLNKKMNKALEYSKQFNLDGVIMIGSDDVITIEYIRYCNKRLIEDENVMLGFLDIYLAGDGTIKHWLGYEGKREGETSGAGRFFSKKSLEKFEWDLFGGLDRNRNLDGTLTSKLTENNLKIEGIRMGTEGSYVIDIKDKCGNNLTHFDRSPGEIVQNKDIYPIFKGFDLERIIKLTVGFNSL